jgi:hypothetical protein
MPSAAVGKLLESTEQRQQRVRRISRPEAELLRKQLSQTANASRYPKLRSSIGTAFAAYKPMSRSPNPTSRERILPIGPLALSAFRQSPSKGGQ